jgi:phosphatidylserine/phosphatidylglycerophosphate/cardiolipin synthase-like enzyme
MPPSAELLNLIRQVATGLPPATLDELLRSLEEHGDKPYDGSLKSKLLLQIPTPGGRHVANKLVDAWVREQKCVTANGLAVALAAASYSDKAAQEKLSVQLVWTGPTEDVPVRRTSQALLQIVNEAKKDLLIVSFAIYNIPEIVEALSAAITRGVRLTLVAETPDESEGKVSYGALPTLGDTLIKQSQVYVWPKEKRTVDSQGRYGSLHVKCAVADDDVAYITSANLTGYAMTINMEMGALIRSREFTGQVRSHIEGLIFKKILVPLKQ